MKKKALLTRTLISLAISALGLPLAANAALNFSNAPAGSATKEPAPNVIVSVDNSGSMGTDGILALKNALKATFDPSFIEDGRIRMAYQAMWGCSGNSKSPIFDSANPTKDISCGAFVPMASLTGSHTKDDGSHRRKFFQWIETLKHGSNTPTHLMMYNAGEYLKLTGIYSPWNAIPGQSDNKPIACRRAYHILMTDGGWNYYDDMPMFDGTFKTGNAEIWNQNLDNADGTKKTLPDGKIYDPASAESRVYADPWGRQTIDAGFNSWKGNASTIYKSLSACNDKTKNCKPTAGDFEWRDIVPTISDMAFHYWSTDLQPGLKSNKASENVIPIIKKSGAEPFKVGDKEQVLSEYWNPKNNPATWRHMTTFTIGFKGAATWPAISTDPIFTTGTFDGHFADLVVGNKKWINPIQPPMHINRMPIRDGYTWYSVPSNAERYPEKFKVGTTNYYADAEDVRQQELWHIALNSRGKFYPAKTADDLKQAFGDILRNIVEDTSKPITSYAATSRSVASGPAYLYAAGYDANGWKGQVESFSLAKGTGSGSANSGWSGETTATLLDKKDKTSDMADRKIYTAKSDTGSVIPFEWNKLHSTQQNALKKTTETGTAGTTAGKNRLNFIRGDRRLEGDTTAAPFRVRASRHGDIVNSAVWYTGAPSAGSNLPGYSKFATDKKSRTPMLYVGANDGMLHGFSATNGAEKFGYIPQGLIPKLIALTEPSYSHQYYVDGSPFSGDVPTSSTNWKTMLVGTLGAGGKGYFVLDVTDPESATDLVYIDQTASSDNDLGHIFGAPVVTEFDKNRSVQITSLNNGRWALITGNGYNSASGRPVLMIQYLTGADKSVKKIIAASSGIESTDNGLSSPRPIDLNGDGIIDVVYAGDLKGNMWKFNLSSKNDAEWGVAFSDKPLFTAKDTNGSRQPITSAPVMRKSKSVNGLMVAFGTGQNLTDGDRSDRESVQSFYSILDDANYELDDSDSNKGAVKIKKGTEPTTVKMTDLAKRTYDYTEIKGTGASSDKSFFKMSETQEALTYAKDTDGNRMRGWYLNFPAGQRVLDTPTFYDADILNVTYETPASGGNVAEESCSPPALEGKQYFMLQGIEFGLAPTSQLVDLNNDGIFDENDKGVNGGSSSSSSAPPLFNVPGGARKITGKEAFTKESTPELGKLPAPPMTINWRQLQ